MRDLASEPDFAVAHLNVRPSLACIEAAGSPVRVEPKVMEMLIALWRAGGRTVSRDQLIESCWQGRVVSDDAITRVLGKVRQIATLTDPPAFHVETLPKVGIRLVPSAAKPDPVVVVLPFDNLGAGDALDYFSDGVAEEILGRLVRGSGLKVVGRATSSRYRGAAKADAARELRASHVVDGAVQRSGDRVRITVHLNETGSRTTLWSQRFDRELSDIFALQDEIAEQIATALDTVFSAPAKPAIPPAAYDLYLRTKPMIVAPEAIAASIASLEAVVAEAPGFADGWARLAAMRAWHAVHLPYADRPDQIAQARVEIARCRALDPGNPEVIYAEFWLSPPFGAFAEQDAMAKRVLAATPQASDAHALAAFHLINVGRCREALAHGRAAFALNPRDWAASCAVIYGLWCTGHSEATLEAADAHLVNWPDDHLIAAVAIVGWARLGRWDRFDALVTPDWLERHPLREHSGILAVSHVIRHPSTENRAFLMANLKTRLERASAADPIILFWAWHLGLGESVFPVLETLPFGPTGGRTDSLGVTSYRTLSLFFHDFPQLRESPHFPHYCARLGLAHYWLETGCWPDCADDVPYDFRAACAQAVQETPQDRFLGAA